MGPPVFKTGERCFASLAGSIPVRLRCLRERSAGRCVLGWPQLRLAVLAQPLDGLSVQPDLAPANKFDADIGLTLYVSGTVVSGILVSGKRFLELMAD